MRFGGRDICKTTEGIYRSRTTKKCMEIEQGYIRFKAEQKIMEPKTRSDIQGTQLYPSKADPCVLDVRKEKY